MPFPGHPSQAGREPGTPWTLPLVTLAVAALCGALGTPQARADAGVRLWDTGSSLGNPSTQPDRSGWKLVPSDLLTLEKDPPKASSDPGYYGREYSFHGDAVVQTPRVIAVFQPSLGRVLLYPGDFAAGRVVDYAPEPPPGAAPGSARLELQRNAGDEVILGMAYAAGARGGDGESGTRFSFDRSEIVEIHPPATAKHLRLVSPIEYGVVPGFIGDDLVLTPREPGASTPLNLPSEHVFVGLLSGGQRELVVTWSNPGRGIRLQPGDASASPTARGFTALDLDAGGGSVFVAALTAPGLWHRQTLVATNLEADVRLPWTRPFPARWKTQLTEGDVRTTFTFREGRGQIWRGVPGSYSYPAWFEGDAAFLHPSKKVPPRGEAVIYHLEGQETPVGVTTPADIVKATLGRTMAGAILDPTGRKLRTHHRRGGEGVRRACTCGCTEAIQDVFEAGQEVDRRDYIQSALDDMIYFVARHVERIGEYQQFASEMVGHLDAAAKSSPALTSYIDPLREIVSRIPQECTLQSDHMKSPQHADELARRTLALTSRREPGNVKAYMQLLKEWRDMGGAQDYVVALCHQVTRKLHQEAGSTAIGDSAAAVLGTEIRQRCRGILRNPDGYEIWDEY